MEAWKTVWREGFVPTLTLDGLKALRAGLQIDDPRITQGSTTTPPPLMCVREWPIEACCVLVFCGWQAGLLKAETVGCAEEYFAIACYQCDLLMKESAVCRYFLNWYDETGRDEMRRELLVEVDLAIATKSS